MSFIYIGHLEFDNLFKGGYSRKEGGSGGGAATGSGVGYASGYGAGATTTQEQDHRYHAQGQQVIKRLLDTDTSNREAGKQLSMPIILFCK